MTGPQNHLVIMAKQPVAGRVKSRLAKDIGIARATGVYRNLMTTTMRTLSRDSRWRTWAAIAPDRAIHDHHWQAGINLIRQGEGNLGDRMQRIFTALPPGPVIIIGTDIPFIRGRDIADAFKLLGPNNVVFGSAGDGGYWLIGVRRSPKIPKLFAGVRWSGKHALTDTLNNVDTLKVGQTTTRFDIDIKVDYLRWRKLKV